MKQRFYVWAVMGDQTFDLYFVTYQQWAQETARRLIDDWADRVGVIDNITWGYQPT
jgi:hypothetical protein